MLSWFFQTCSSLYESGPRILQSGLYKPNYKNFILNEKITKGWSWLVEGLSSTGPPRLVYNWNHNLQPLVCGSAVKLSEKKVMNLTIYHVAVCRAAPVFAQVCYTLSCSRLVQYAAGVAIDIALWKRYHYRKYFGLCWIFSTFITFLFLLPFFLLWYINQ